MHMSIHDLKELRASSHNRQGTFWTELSFATDRGQKFELIIYASSVDEASALADAINNLPPRMLEAPKAEGSH